MSIELLELKRETVSKDLQHLFHVPVPPERLYIQGKEKAFQFLSLIPARGLGVVGTRRAQHRGLMEVERRLAELQFSRLVILSGMALGIDSAAHRMALRFSLPTIAVLGCGLDLTYPPENEGLRQEILESNGLIVSEYPPGTPPARTNFLNRNRLIVGWSQAVWVVQAAHRSGALNTAWWAEQQGKPIFVTPGYPGDLHLAGNQRLLQKRSGVFCYYDSSDLRDVWEEMAGKSARAGKRNRPADQGLLFESLQSDEQRLLQRVQEQVKWRGSVQVHELLDWALSKAWTPQRFFVALKNALNRGVLEDSNGLLLPNSAWSKG